MNLYDLNLAETKTIAKRYRIPMSEYVYKIINGVPVRGRRNKRKIDLQNEIFIKLGTANVVHADAIYEWNVFNRFRTYRINLDPAIYNTEKKLYNKIIEYERKYAEQGQAVQFVILHFIEIATGRERSPISVKLDTVRTFADFKEFLENARLGTLESGSDAINSELYKLVLNVFDMVTYEVLQGGGKTNYNLFKAVGIDGGKKKLCGYYCLKLIHPEIELTEEQYIAKELYKYINLDKYISDNNLKICVVANCFKITAKLLKFLDNPNKIKTTVKGRTVLLSKLDDEDIENVYMTDDQDDIKGTILFNIQHEHYDILVNNKIELDDIYVDGSMTVYKKIGDKYDICYRANELTENNKLYGIDKLNQAIETEYLIPDYETVIEWKKHNANKPYSLTWLHLSEAELSNLNKIDLEHDEDGLKDFIKQNAHFRLSFDCTADFEKYIRRHGKNKVFKIITFNGSCFDNFILYNDLKNLKIDDIGTPFFNGNNLLDFTIAGRHSMFDIRKHVSGSLEECCKSYKINICAKKKFDFRIAQEQYDNGTLMEYMNNNINEIKTYNTYDVIATALVYYRYREGLKANETTKKYGKDLTKYRTIGSLMKTVLDDDLKERKINLPIFYNSKWTKEKNKRFMGYYNDILKYKVGGRVELFNGRKRIIGKMASPDVCGLYPFVMACYDVYYPYGEIEEVKSIKDMPKDKIGFFYCDIDQKNLKLKIMPEKTKTENVWDTKNVLENYFISTIKIKELIRHGANVKTYNGIYFTKKMKSCELFKILLPLMQERNKQDILKMENSDQYNPVLRETLKLLTNVLSGKLIEGLHLDKIVEIKESNIYVPKDGDEAIHVTENSVFISTKKDQEKNMRYSKPVYLGVLIYDYAQKYMYNYMYNKINRKDLVYTDTDSNKLTERAFKKWLKYASTKTIPHWKEVEIYDPRYKMHKLYEENSKTFGSFVDEYKEKAPNNDISYWVDKKEYITTVMSTDQDVIDKNTVFRFKGISQNDILLKDNFEINEETNQDLYNMYQSDGYKIKNNYIGLFEKLVNNGRVKILTQQFTRSIKKFDFVGVMINYRIKNIRLKK